MSASFQDVAQDVAVAVVTHNSGHDLAKSLDALTHLEPPIREVCLVDCASGDHSVAVARSFEGRLPLDVEALPDNRGFAGGMNLAVERTHASWILSLNADAWPSPDYVARLVARAEAHPELKVGAVTGRLVRTEGDLLDACGMRLTRTWRHLDRGSGEPDRRQYAEPERVFGATGAASLFRREALLDAAVDGEVFDPRFHSFREDAELAFRLRERGWEVLYEPKARCRHRRFNLPKTRRRMPPAVNYHSLKNRYLLRAYHQTGRNFVRTLVPTLFRDVLALGWVLLAEHSSLAAYTWLWRHRREIRARRRAIQARQTVAPEELERWFHTDGLPPG